MKSKILNMYSNQSTSFLKFYTLAFLLFFAGAISAQENTKMVQGRVIDAVSGQPIAAAQINISDKNTSAVADENGVFTIKTTSVNDILEISAYGFASREVAVQGRKSVEVKLFSDKFTSSFGKIHGIDGLVKSSQLVNATKQVSDLSNASTIVVDDIIQNALGADVRSTSRSGLAGIGSNFFIRGVNSLNINAQPLFVVDGVIWDNFQNQGTIHGGFFTNPLDNLDINDIEAISVVKDGTSIYGSKGANGVIVIKTKRATDMVTKISLNVLTGTTNVPGSVPMMNAEQHRLYASDMLSSLGFEGNDVSGVGFLTEDKNNSAYNVYHNQTDWNKQIYQQGVTQSYLINANGGDEKALYYFSLGLTNNKGVVKTTNFQRINARFNADFNLMKNLNLGLNIGFTRNERTLMDDGVNYFSSPTWLANIKSPFVSPYAHTVFGEITANPARTDIFGVGNPSALIDLSLNFQKKYRFNISVNPSYKITPDLTISDHFDYSIYKTIDGHYIPMLFTQPRFLENKGISNNEITSLVFRNTNFFNNFKLNYDKKFDTYHALKAVLGSRFISNFVESDYAEEHNSGSNNNTTITGDYDYLYVTGKNDHTKSISNYLNVDYAYDNRYFVNIAASMDASSRFGKNVEGALNLGGVSWGLFPSVNLGWNVTSESFMKNLSAISFMKLRAGYGLSGNDGLGDYQSMAYFTSVRFMDRANGLIISNLQNDKIQWETTAKLNAGLDLGLFNDRLNLTLDVYNNTTSDLLTLRTLPEYSGLGNYWSNGGTMNNKGFEVSANLKVLNLKDVKWELGASVGSFKNKILTLPDDAYLVNLFGGQLLVAEDQPFGQFYGYKSNGVFSTQAEADAANVYMVNADGELTKFGAGDVIFEDVDQNNIINDADKQVIGNSSPDFYGNFNSKLNVGRFTLNTLFSYSYGNDVYNYSRSQLEAGSGFFNQTTALLNRWSADGQITNQPKATFNDPMQNARFSDRWIEDGSYLKLKSVSLSYELPLKSDYIEGLNFWVSAENLVTWSNYLGLDPEVTAGNSPYLQGVDAGLLPLTQSYYVGLKINL